MYRNSKYLYEFGPFRLDAGERLLLRNGEAVPLTPKAFDVLLALVEQPGRLLEKEVLMRAVWRDSFVEENNLADNISRLRKALGEGENGQKFIETVPKRGYRFVAPVREVNGESLAPSSSVEPVTVETAAAPLPARLAATFRLRKRSIIIMGLFALLLTAFSVGLYWRFKPAPPAESLAVLPFSADPQTEYLSDGITESLINHLSQLSGLRVTARATSFSYKGKKVNPYEVGRDLNVNTIMTGRVALRDDVLTVQVELVDAATGTQRWGERYQRNLSDIFAVEEEVGRQITENLRLKLSGLEQQRLSKRYTDNVEVYQIYLQGRYLLSKPTKQGLHRAIDYFQQALAKDPNYAPAYTVLANCDVLLSTEEGPENLLPQAKVSLVRALEIDANLAEAHAELGFIRWLYDLDWPGAESEVQQALKINPNSAEAHFTYAKLLADVGRFDEAHTQALRSVELDPLSLQIRKRVPYVLLLARRYDEAIAEYQKLIEIAPDFLQIQRELGVAYELKGRYQEAFSQFHRAYEMPENYGPTILRADLGYLYAVWGKRTEAQQILAELIRKSEQSYVSAYDIAVIYAGLGETEQAFKWLDKAMEQHPFWLVWLKVDPRLDGLHQNPHFQSLMRHFEQSH